MDPESRMMWIGIRDERWEGLERYERRLGEILRRLPAVLPLLLLLLRRPVTNVARRWMNNPMVMPVGVMDELFLGSRTTVSLVRPILHGANLRHYHYLCHLSHPR
jgi:hypothetical protein